MRSLLSNRPLRCGRIGDDKLRLRFSGAAADRDESAGGDLGFAQCSHTLPNGARWEVPRPPRAFLQCFDWQPATGAAKETAVVATQRLVIFAAENSRHRVCRQLPAVILYHASTDGLTAAGTPALEAHAVPRMGAAAKPYHLLTTPPPGWPRDGLRCNLSLSTSATRAPPTSRDRLGRYLR